MICWEENFAKGFPARMKTVKRCFSSAFLMKITVYGYGGSFLVLFNVREKYY